MHNTLLSSVYILAERVRASVEREIVIHPRPLTIKGGTLSYSSKKKKNELTRNVISGPRGERDLCKNKNPRQSPFKLIKK